VKPGRKGLRNERKIDKYNFALKKTREGKK
jgi:hypothetical protein